MKVMGLDFLLCFFWGGGASVNSSEYFVKSYSEQSLGKDKPFQILLLMANGQRHHCPANFV